MTLGNHVNGDIWLTRTGIFSQVETYLTCNVILCQIVNYTGMLLKSYNLNIGVVSARRSSLFLAEIAVLDIFGVFGYLYWNIHCSVRLCQIVIYVEMLYKTDNLKLMVVSARDSSLFFT